ncbi:MAG: signal recognition particle-docking protein FtsY [Candidatus Bathyarchaeia archaeon]|nr:signal recognition particle-docking protein FtsY [Candidatus Bathyarchaeota archaeon]
MFERLKQGLKGVLDKISKTQLSEEDLDPILEDLQLQLISNDVAFEVASGICAELKKRLRGASISRFEERERIVRAALAESIRSVMATTSEADLIKLASSRKGSGRPLTIMFIGVNGTGKTTTIAKVAKLLMDRGFKVILASSDTYRAGAIEQLEEHARRLHLRVIRHTYGADPAAVGFDAVQHAASRGMDAVLIDTAGRMQTNRNLMDELKKIKRVVQPDLTILIVDALTGNDAVQQAMAFDKGVGFDAVILAKVDADAKGGSSLSVPYATGKPIIYIGTGQGYDDLQPFDPEWFSERILPLEE